SIFFNEVASRIDQRRVHFTGHLKHPDYIRALQVSSAHVYLTYPFVLSWSLIEALSVGCVVIASDTAPVREVINSEENGILVPFSDVSQLPAGFMEVLPDPSRFGAVGKNARHAVEEKYDMRNCVPELMKILKTRRAANSTSRNRRHYA